MGTIAAISQAAAEQSSGLGVVNDAVVELEQMTQCNAGLVEQGAAAAASLHEQALQLSHAVSHFRGGGPGLSAARATTPEERCFCPAFRVIGAAPRR